MDRRIGGRVLNSMMENDDYCCITKDNEWHPVQSTSYRLLILAVKHINVNENDVFVDVGCGFGRVISYMIIKKKKCRYIGIDINKNAVEIAKERFKQYDNVTIIRDNILNCVPFDGSTFYLFNPFGKETLDQFLSKLEENTNGSIMLYYLNPVHKSVFENHSEWQLVKEVVLKPKYHLPIDMSIYKLR